MSAVSILQLTIAGMLAIQAVATAPRVADSFRRGWRLMAWAGLALVTGSLIISILCIALAFGWFS